MKIATWNVNSVNARLDHVLTWFRDVQPDVAALQEIKCIDEKFPAEAFESLGYNVAVHGQKTYNGVALLSKYPLEDIQRGLPGDDGDEQARYIEALIASPRPVRVGGIYLPNGNPVDSEKFPYKLSWFKRLQARAEALLAHEEPLALIGDYNVIPGPEDCYDPKAWEGDALYRPESRAAFRALTYLGFTSAVDARAADPHGYTFWDYQAGAWPRDHGIRIDHILLSPQAADRLIACEIDREVRGREKPSDHVPVIVTLAD